jgi:hypothetical protein
MVQAGGGVQVHHLVVLGSQVVASALKVSHLHSQQESGDSKMVVKKNNQAADSAPQGWARQYNRHVA